MKYGHALAIGTLALALAACGGSHHDDGSRTTDPVITDPGLGLTNDYRIEAVLTSPSVDPGYLYRDPLNLQVLENVTFQLVSYSGSGSSLVRTVAPSASSLGDPTGAQGVTFTTNDTRNATGSVGQNDGSFNIANRDSGTQRYIVTATYNGTQYSSFYQINPRLDYARVHGIVAERTSADGVSPATYRGVYNAQVVFYEQRDPLVDPASDPAPALYAAQTVRTGPDGTFRAAVPVPPTNTGDVPVVRALVLPPDEFNPSFSFGEATVPYPSFGSPAQSDLRSLPDLGINTPNGGGDFFLIQPTDITRIDNNTFTLNDESLASRLFVLTPASNAAAARHKAAKK